MNTDRTVTNMYMEEIGRVPLLSREEELALTAKCRRGNRKARQKLICSNLRLVVKIAMSYLNLGLPLLDLISEGNIGLMKAVDRYDPNKGGRLSTYAAWWIKQSIMRALANQAKTIRLPTHIVDKLCRMRKVQQKLTAEYGRQPAIDELAEALEVEPETIRFWKRLGNHPSSLDAPNGPDDTRTYGETLICDYGSTPFDEVSAKQAHEDLNQLIDQLSPRERTIIRDRFGLNGSRKRTLEDIGMEFNITRERVRQIQRSAISALREMMNDREKTVSDHHEHKASYA